MVGLSWSLLRYRKVLYANRTIFYTRYKFSYLEIEGLNKHIRNLNFPILMNLEVTTFQNILIFNDCFVTIDYSQNRENYHETLLKRRKLAQKEITV